MTLRIKTTRLLTAAIIGASAITGTSATPAAAQNAELEAALIGAIAAIIIGQQTGPAPAPAPPPQPVVETRQYCFGSNVNVLTGNFDEGFYAEGLGRGGNILYYTRRAGTNRYVNNAGHIYIIYDDNSAAWLGSTTAVDMRRC
jgi:hypothetical protein